MGEKVYEKVFSSENTFSIYRKCVKNVRNFWTKYEETDNKKTSAEEMEAVETEKRYYYNTYKTKKY